MGPFRWLLEVVVSFSETYRFLLVVLIIVFTVVIITHSGIENLQDTLQDYSVPDYICTAEDVKECIEH